MRPRPLLILLLAAACVAVPDARPARAQVAKATWQEVAYVPGYSAELQKSVLLRYDLAEQDWLDPLSDPLLGGVNQLAADDAALYVLETYARVVRIPHDGSGSSVVAEGSPARIAVGDGRLFVLDTSAGTSVVRCLDRTTGAVLGERALPVTVYAFAVATAERRLVFAADRDLLGVDYAADGSLGPVVAPDPIGPRHFIPELFAFPDGRRILEVRSARVYDARTLRYAGSLPADGASDVAFGDGSVFVASDEQPRDQVIGISDGSFAEIGRTELPSWTFPTLFVHGGTVFVVSFPSGEVQLDVRPIASLAPPPLPAPLDPKTVSYEPLEIVVTPADVVLARATWYKENESRDQYLANHLFRWSLVTRGPLASIPLRDVPLRFLYDAGGDALYVLYADRRITRIVDPGGADPHEALFAVAPFMPGAVARLGGRLLVSDAHERDAIFAFGADGAPLRTVDPGFDHDAPSDLATSEATGEIFAFVSSFDDTVWRFRLDSQARPIAVDFDELPGSAVMLRPSPDGEHLYEGFSVRAADTLAPGPPLPSTSWYRQGAAWFGGALVLLKIPRLESYEPPFASPTWSYELEMPSNSTLDLLAPANDGLVLAYTTWNSDEYHPVNRYAKIRPGNDIDRDGSANANDVFPLDPTDWADRDGDGVGDNNDPFPDDDRYSMDSDGDGIPDEVDDYPARKEVATAWITFTVGASVPPFGALRGNLRALTHVFDNGNVLICPDGDSCIPGSFTPRRGGRLEIELDPSVVDALEAGLEAELEETFARLRGRPVDLALAFRRDKLRLTARVTKDGGRLRVDLRFPYVATTSDLRVRRIHGVFRMRGDEETLAATYSGR